MFFVFFTNFILFFSTYYINFPSFVIFFPFFKINYRFLPYVGWVTIIMTEKPIIKVSFTSTPSWAPFYSYKRAENKEMKNRKHLNNN